MRKTLSSLSSSFRALTASAALCVLLQACTDDSYHGSAERYRDDDIALPVNVFVGEPDRAETKGLGAIDFENGVTFEGRNIYVYAFCGAAGTDFSVLSSADRSNTLVDASADTSGYLGGKQAVLTDIQSYAYWTGSDRPIYPIGDMKSVPYDFYAYYVDSLQLGNDSIHRTRDSITVDVAFDGCMDLMTAHSIYRGEPEDSLIAYSYMTARKGINPVFTFDHKLVKLNFVAVAGVVESRKNKILTIQDLKVVSLTRANMTVAYKGAPSGDGIRFDASSIDSLVLKEKDGSDMPRDTYVIINPPPTEDTPPLKIAGSLLAAPAQSYKIYLTMREINAAGEHEGVCEIDLEYPEGFNIGCSYLVTLKIFGFMDVEPTIQLVPWNFGGDIYLPDYENPEEE